MEHLAKLKELKLIQHNKNKFKSNKFNQDINDFVGLDLGVDQLLQFKIEKNNKKNNKINVKKPGLPKIIKKPNLEKLTNDTYFKKLYVRGDLPFNVNMNFNPPKINFIIDPLKLDFNYYIPILLEGLFDKSEPFFSICVIILDKFFTISLKKIKKALKDIITPIKSYSIRYPIMR